MTESVDGAGVVLELVVVEHVGFGIGLYRLNQAKHDSGMKVDHQCGIGSDCSFEVCSFCLILRGLLGIGWGPMED